MKEKSIVVVLAAAMVVSEPVFVEHIHFHDNCAYIAPAVFENELWHNHVEVEPGPWITTSSAISASGNLFQESYQLQLTPILMRDMDGNPTLQSVYFTALPSIDVRKRMQSRCDAVGDLRRALSSILASDEQVAYVEAQLLDGQTVVFGGHYPGSMMTFDERTLRRMGINYQPSPLSS